MAITHDWVNFSSCVIHQNNQTKVIFLECLIRSDEKGYVFEKFLLVIVGGSYNPVVLIIRILRYGSGLTSFFKCVSFDIIFSGTTYRITLIIRTGKCPNDTLNVPIIRALLVFLLW